MGYTPENKHGTSWNRIMEIWKLNFHFKGMMFKFQFLGSNGFLTLQVSGAKDGNDGSDENVAAMDASGAMGNDAVMNFSHSTYDKASRLPGNETFKKNINSFLDN